MKITASNTQLVQPKVSPTNNNVAEGVLKLDEKNIPSFSERLSAGLENDLARVMVGQQVSSLAFQLTLNVRNKALSAYKDIMNMPV